MKQLNIESVSLMRLLLSKILNSLPVHPEVNGRYTALAKTNIEQGRMWTGDILMAEGAPYPYNDKNHAPTGLSNESFDFLKFDKLDRLKYVREALGELQDVLAQWYIDLPGNGTPIGRFKVKMAIRNAYTNVRQGRLWLGMELAEVLKNSGKESAHQ